jgi:hypothetical protein
MFNHEIWPWGLVIMFSQGLIIMFSQILIMKFSHHVYQLGLANI